MEETQQPKNENDNENEKLAMFNKKYNTELKWYIRYFSINKNGI